MSSKLTPTALPTPPNEYNIGYMDRLVKQISLEFTKSRAVTPFTCGSDLSGEAGFPISGLTIVNPPISSTGSPPDGFPEGSVWCDTTSENSLKIITSGPYTDQDSLNLANTTDPALGDALVGFRQSNASGNLTGAVGRTVHGKLQEIISVKDFGAVGNGVADDTAAIQAAIDYANSESLASAGTPPVLFPAGVYKTTSVLTVSGNFRFIGSGWPIIKVAHNGDAIICTGIPSAVSFPRNITTFEGLVFNTQSGSTPASIIRLGTASGATPSYINAINDVRIVNCVFDLIEATHVIDNNRGFGLVITGCTFTNIAATSAIKLRQDQTEIPYWSYAVSIYATDFTNITGKAIEADGGDLAVYGSIIEGCSQGAVEVGMNTAYTGSQPTSFYGVYFEAN